MLECGMQEQDRRALQRNTAILTESMAEGIMAEQTSHKRSFRLLLLLPKRGPRAFSGFCSALQETEQQHLKETSVKRSVDSSLPLPTQEESNAKEARTQESMELSLDADSPIKTPVLPAHDFYLSHFQQSYRVSSSPRGLALVISNVTFDPCAAPDLDTRKGGEVDDDVLRKVFTELDYKVTVHRDLTAQDMRTCIESFTRRPDHHSGDSSVVCLLSHGVEGAIYAGLGCLSPLTTRTVRCYRTTQDVFYSGLRGEEMDCGVEQIERPDEDLLPQLHGSHEEHEERVVVHSGAELLLRLNARDTHLADILVQVNGRIKEREGYAPGTRHHRCKEMSEFTSSLCKNLYFFPKYHPQY
ncbi:hypothetical protein KUCAC02_014510 [Chaenocephalus aceratus]|uniref:Uncharacterized protein n=1 Tax=Chaenocephalus aceratus TaxID=36190 RepID=A0ACB9WFP7_CHAAC|nr:hypothetical protein KUCAC02_014510 [Chaenocephalus aceratus]